MKLVFKIISIILLFTISGLGSEKTGLTGIETIDLMERMNINRIDLPLQNNGMTGDDGRTYYPSGQNVLNILFQGGFGFTGYVNDELRGSFLAVSALIEEWQPGIWGISPDDPFAKFYNVNSQDGFGSQAFLDWQTAVNLGADFQDLDKDGVYDPNVDRPDILGDKTIWFPINDNTSIYQRTPKLGTKPIGLDMYVSVWAYNLDNHLDDIVFFRYRLINATDTLKHDLIFSIFADSDIGDYNDDLIGCDSLLNFGFTYNDLDDPEYGLNPPAFGVQVLQGPIIQSFGDTSICYLGNHFELDTLYNSTNLEISSFISHPGYISTFPDPVPINEMRSLQNGGYDWLGRPIDPTLIGIGGTSSTNPKYLFSGDPVSASGWRCDDPEDWRMLVNCGPFDLHPGEQQDIIIAYLAGQGTSALNSLSVLKKRARFLKNFFPEGRIFKITSNQQITSTDSVFIFNTRFESAVKDEKVLNIDWNLLNKPDGSNAQIEKINDRQALLDIDLQGEYKIEAISRLTTDIILKDTISVNGIDNHPPQAKLLFSKNKINFGESVLLDGSSSYDPDLDSIYFSWELPDWLGYSDSNTSILDFYPKQIGKGEISIFVTDSIFEVTKTDSIIVDPLMHDINIDTILSNLNPIKHLQFHESNIYVLDTYSNLSILDAKTYSVKMKNVQIGDSKFLVQDSLIISNNESVGIYIGKINSNYQYQQCSYIDERYYSDSEIHLDSVYLYILYHTINIYDLSDVYNPILINTFQPPRLISDFSISDGYGVLKSRIISNVLTMYDLSDPLNLVVMDTLQFSFSDAIVTYKSGVIYLVDDRYKEEILLIDASNPSELRHAGKIEVSSFYLSNTNKPILNIHTKNKMLYVSTIDGIVIYDINDPYDPLKKAHYLTGLQPNTLTSNFPFVYADFWQDNNNSIGLSILRLETFEIPKPKLPENYFLYQNFPNPFNPGTTIKYDLPNDTKIRLQIYDILGRKVRTLIDKFQKRDQYQAYWDGLNETGKQVSSGIYFYSLQTDDFVKTKKMLLIR